jgi:hypothetical protein
MDTKQSGPATTPARPNAEDPTKDPHGDVLSLGQTPLEIRPHCRVVGAYCEALYWLRREPLSRATTCCRHYWADAKREAS